MLKYLKRKALELDIEWHGLEKNQLIDHVKRANMRTPGWKFCFSKDLHCELKYEFEIMEDEDVLYSYRLCSSCESEKSEEEWSEEEWDAILLISKSEYLDSLSDEDKIVTNDIRQRVLHKCGQIKSLELCCQIEGCVVDDDTILFVGSELRFYSTNHVKNFYFKDYTYKFENGFMTLGEFRDIIAFCEKDARNKTHDWDKNIICDIQQCSGISGELYCITWT